MSHGLQIVKEFRASKATDAIALEVSTAEYFNLSQPSMWDTVHGIWFYLELQAIGTDPVTIQLQGAADKAQTVWTNIGAAFSQAVGATVEKKAFERAPLVSAAASAFTSLPPFLRFEMVAIYKINRTARGLA
jgi:hypothetical protein